MMRGAAEPVRDHLSEHEESERSVHATPTSESAVGESDSSYTCHAIATT